MWIRASVGYIKGGFFSIWTPELCAKHLVGLNGKLSVSSIGLLYSNLDLRRKFCTPSTDLGLQSERQVKSVSVRKSPLKWSYTYGVGTEPLIGATIGQLLEQEADANPHREAFVSVHQDIRLTVEQLLLQSDALAAGLLSLGVERGDRVGIWAPNCIEWILIQYATARAGMILVNINPAYQSSELEFSLKKVGIKALVMSETFKTQDYYGMILRLCPEIADTKNGNEIQTKFLPDLKRVILISEKHLDGMLRFDDVMQLGSQKDVDYIHDLQYKLQCNDPINIQFTSGTTGFPKGATLSHHSIVNNAQQIGFRMAYDKETTRICVPVPLYHCFGMVMGSLQAVVHSATVVLTSAGFDAKSTLKAVHSERCTSLYGTPTMFIDMLRLPDFNQFDLKSLRTGIMAGSVCPVEVMKEVVERMHMTECTICYGTTENSPVTFQTFPHDNLERKVSTVGKIQSYTEGKIVDDAGHVVPVGETGEICIRGYCVMRGYWGDEEQTTNAIGEDGWYKTGDLGFIDEDGYGRIIGRKKDVVIRGGENIYPAEIEQFLFKHPKILDVQIIGVPDNRLGEQIAAWIRVKEDEILTAEEVTDFCKEQIAHYKVPHYISFVKEFPLTVSGKVQKFKMREMAVKMYKLQKHGQNT